MLLFSFKNLCRKFCFIALIVQMNRHSPRREYLFIRYRREGRENVVRVKIMLYYGFPNKQRHKVPKNLYLTDMKRAV